jgi:hypothetical protein
VSLLTWSCYAHSADLRNRQPGLEAAEVTPHPARDR